MPTSLQTATRIFRILLVLIVAVGIAWVTNSVNASVQSALPYIIAVLFAWECTRILTIRYRKRKKRAPREHPSSG
ncbi:MAG: hypothetical protein F4X72_00280 [Dehalococcoidia bacterium]|nr:hypothetical protein [Dehalococcoidia bacterium]